jgi:hypothetical protein
MFGSLAMLCWLLAGVWKVHRIIRRAPLQRFTPSLV